MMKRVTSKIPGMLALPFADKVNLFAEFYYRLKGKLYYRRVFGSFGRGSAIHAPMLISNPGFMHIGEKVMIRKGVRLEVIQLDPAHPPELRIGNNVDIGQDVHIVAMGKVIIRDNVSITGRCSLLCGTHPFMDVNNPVKIGHRLSGKNAVIEIGEGSFLGIGSVIQMNVRIGRHVVIGSNSVVRKNVPDYSVAEGNPAAVVLRYEKDSDRWVPVAPDAK
jgi:acetyltransferase-like isoleucine patch superfamily enzyme